jgi:hypothetical protein
MLESSNRTFDAFLVIPNLCALIREWRCFWFSGNLLHELCIFVSVVFWELQKKSIASSSITLDAYLLAIHGLA